MAPSVDFVQGIDAMAPGLSRAQAPLLDALQRRGEFSMRPVRFPFSRGAAVFPFLYGPLPAWLLLRGADVVHLANSWYAHLVPLLPRPVVVTCHDLIEWQEIASGERQVKPHRRFHAAAGWKGLLQADRIVCDSRAVANEIAALAPEVETRLRVVHLGVSSAFRPGSADVRDLKRLGVSQPYVLYVGSEQQRKNLVRLVEAVGMAARELHFVKVGGSQTGEGRDALLGALRRAGLAKRSVLLESVSDQDLITLYRGASVTALVSLAEGFGFPAIEAMSCGSPVLVSDRSSLPEITDGHAVVVDPCNVPAMTHAIDTLVENVAAGARDTSAHAAFASSYTWERAAMQYEEIYREVLAEA